jgi:hypothetical protein
LCRSAAIYWLDYAKGLFGRKSAGVFGAFFNALLLVTTLTFVANKYAPAFDGLAQMIPFPPEFRTVL